MKEVEDFIKTNKTCLVEFWASWCGPCKKLSPILDEVNSQVPVLKLSIEACPTASSEYSILSVPTMLAFRDGRFHGQLNGFQEKANILKMFDL